MTTEQVILELNRRASEHLDGHLIIGFVAGGGDPIVCCNADSPALAIALNGILSALISRGGISVTKPNGDTP